MTQRIFSAPKQLLLITISPAGIVTWSHGEIMATQPPWSVFHCYARLITNVRTVDRIQLDSAPSRTAFSHFSFFLNISDQLRIKHLTLVKFKLFCSVKGTVSRYFWHFFDQKTPPGPIWTSKNSLAKCFVFAKIFVKHVCLCSQRRRWHRVSVVNNYADILFSPIYMGPS